MDNKLETALAYLTFLNPSEADKRLAEEEMGPVPPLEIITPDDCIQCLAYFTDCNVWPGHLFLRGDIWGIYLKSIADSRFHKSLDVVLAMGTPGDLILYLRACYKFGYQVIPDQEYDALEMLYLKAFPSLEYLNATTNDDSIYTPAVVEALRYTNLRSTTTASPKPLDGSAYASLNSEKSTSVRPVRSYEEAYQYLLDATDTPATHWSLKVDGFNTKCMFAEGKGLEVAVSRGRAADGWDYTEAIQRVLHSQNINGLGIVGKVTGEAIVDKEALPLLREKYLNKEYKTPKSTAGAMLRAPQAFEESDYKYLHFYPFDIDGVRKDVAFVKLKECGFSTPPDLSFKYEEIPLASLSEFSEWLDKNVLDPLWAASEEHSIGSDGVVLQLLSDKENDRADKYSDLNIALKFSHWTEAQYISKVKAILFEQRRVEMSVVLEIEPVTTRDLNVATRVSVGSPAILVADDVRVGDTIAFARKSEAINIYLGKR